MQVYDASENPSYDPSLPLQIPDPAARQPVDWDEDEDGVWVAPVIANTAALAASPPFLVTKAPVLEVKNNSHPSANGAASAPSVASAAYRFGPPSPVPAPWPTRDPHLSAEERAKALAEYQEASMSTPYSHKKGGSSSADETKKDAQSEKKNKKGKNKKKTSNNNASAEL